MSDEFIATWRKTLAERPDGTHYDGCHLSHPWCALSFATDEIVRLRAQVEHAHAILASEGAAWLVVGSNHERSWRQSLTPAIQSYWDKYGNYFKEDK
jgi:hypothetical protein